MTPDALLFQALNGLASASSLFLVGVGLSIIFGVSRIVNMAHGSLYMLGIYIAYSFAAHFGGLGFWGGIIASALIVAAVGAAIEIVASCGGSIARPSCSSFSPLSPSCS